MAYSPKLDSLIASSTRLILILDRSLLMFEGSWDNRQLSALQEICHRHRETSRSIGRVEDRSNPGIAPCRSHFLVTPEVRLAAIHPHTFAIVSSFEVSQWLLRKAFFRFRSSSEFFGSVLFLFKPDMLGSKWSFWATKVWKYDEANEGRNVLSKWESSVHLA